MTVENLRFTNLQVFSIHLARTWHKLRQISKVMKPLQIFRGPQGGGGG